MKKTYLISQFRNGRPIEKSLLIASGVLGLIVPGMSAVIFGDRTITNQVTFSDLLFDNAIVFDATTFAIPVQPPTTGSEFTITFPASATNLSVSNTGSVTLTHVPPLVADGSGNLITFNTDGTAGTFGWSSFNTGPLPLGTSNGLKTLTYFSHGFDSGVNMHEFTIDAILPGDWSVSGTSTGDHQFLGVATGFKITQNFVFNPSTDTTTVAAFNPNYPSDGSADALNFILYGAQIGLIPETNLMPILAVGFGIIGLTLARR
jgi:hypothetical protein